ncbi:MAG: hypothetical protein ACFFCP_13720 [Promethearchaeota archaeon]
MKEYSKELALKLGHNAYQDPMAISLPNVSASSLKDENAASPWVD